MMKIYITAILLFIVSIVSGQALLNYPGIPINTNINALTSQPLDGRDTIAVLADTSKLNAFAYKGQITYAYDTDTRWEYNGFGWQPLSYADGYFGADVAAGTATYALAGSLNLDYTLGDFDVDSVRYFYITPRANQGGKDSYIYLGTNKTHNLQLYTNGVGTGFGQLGNTNNFIYFGPTSGRLDLSVASTGFEILDGRSPSTAAGIEYNDSYTYGYTGLSLVHKDYVDSLIIGGGGIGVPSRYTVIDSSHTYIVGDMVAPSPLGWYKANAHAIGDSLPLAMVLETTTHTFDIYADTITLSPQFDSIAVGDYIFLHSDGILYDTPDVLNIPVARKISSSGVFSTIDYRPYLPTGIAGNGSTTNNFGILTPVASLTANDYIVLWDSTAQIGQKIPASAIGGMLAGDSTWVLNTVVDSTFKLEVTVNDLSPDTLLRDGVNIPSFDIRYERGIFTYKTTSTVGGSQAKEVNIYSRLNPNITRSEDNTSVLLNSVFDDYSNWNVSLLKTAIDTKDDTLQIQAANGNAAHNELSINAYDYNGTYDYKIQFIDSVWVDGTLTYEYIPEHGESMQFVTMLDPDDPLKYRWHMVNRRIPSQSHTIYGFSISNNNGANLYAIPSGGSIDFDPGDGLTSTTSTNNVQYSIRAGRFSVENGENTAALASNLDLHTYYNYYMGTEQDSAAAHTRLTFDAPSFDLLNVSIRIISEDTDPTYDNMLISTVGDIFWVNGVYTDTVVLGHGVSADLKVVPDTIYLASSYVWDVHLSNPVVADNNGIYSGSGSLSGATVITGGANQITLNTSATTGFLVQTTSGTGSAIQGNSSTAATGIIGTNTSTGDGGYFSASSGNGIRTQSSTGLAAYHTIAPSSTTGDDHIMQLVRTTTGTATDGIGGSIDFFLKSDATTVSAGHLGYKWDDVTHATRTSSFDIATVNSATESVKFSIAGNGEVTIVADVINLGAIKIITGTGDPEGAVTAPVGSMYLRDDGGTGTTMYVKESGAGNTGWAAK